MSAGERSSYKGGIGAFSYDLTEDGLTKIETTFDEDTVWLSIDQMAELFQRDKSTDEYKKYKARTISDVEEEYLNSIKMLEQKTDKKQKNM